MNPAVLRRLVAMWPLEKIAAEFGANAVRTALAAIPAPTREASP